MQDILQLPATPRLPVLDAQEQVVGAFPVGRVFCVGRNYGDHAREMGCDPDLAPPFFFMKPASAVTTEQTLRYPGGTGALHHEVELIVACDGPRVLACGVGLDLTRRDVQAAMKESRLPWEAGKVFPQAAACGSLYLGAEVLTRASAEISLHVQGELRQSGHLGQMIHDVPTLLAKLDELFGLLPGDLLFTGTPAGVGGLYPGDCVTARVSGLPELTVTILEPV